MSANHIIVTGGAGYLGTRLVEHALAEGRAVTFLGRRPGPPGTHYAFWTLGDPLPPDVDISSDTAMIHFAHDWRSGEQGNVAGTERLFASAREAGVDTRVFISSQSARPDALNRYGRMKWAIEQRLEGATSLRVGLVYGGPRKAMYGLLCRLARLPLLPMIEPWRTVQPIHLDEVARGVLAAADGRARGVLALAGPQPVPFGEMLRLLALAYGGKRLRIVPVPLRPVLLACAVTARLPWLPTVDKERVLGLAGTEPIASEFDLARLGVEVRPVTERLPREVPGRRALLAEGRAFLCYAGAEPSSALLRRYARALPGGAIARPRIGLRWREPLGGGSAVGRRLRVASRIVEASASGEARLARGSLVLLALEGAFETLMLPTRLIASIWQ